MRKNSRLTRGIALLVVVGTLVGTAQPSTPARAATHAQDGSEGWGTQALPSPTGGSLDKSAGVAMADVQSTPQPENFGARADSPIRDAPLDPNDLTVFYNQSIGSGQPSFSPNSPTTANDGKTIMAAYNKYLAISDFYGASWSEFSPLLLLANTLVDPGFDGIHAGLSGDQETLYDPSRDLLFWLVHFDPDSDGNNLQLGVSSDAGSNWLFYQFRPDSIGPQEPGNGADWFKQPHMVLTSNYVYVLSDAIRWPASSPRYSSVIRVSLDSLAAGGAASFAFYYSTAYFGFSAADGGTSTLYFASHKAANYMRIFRWPESAEASGIQHNDVLHAAYLGGAYDCTVGDTGVNPCAALDDRITAGWLRSDLNQLGFMWTAPQGTDGKGTHPFPYIRTLVLDVSVVPPTVLKHDATYDANKALFLPSAGVNARGHVGGSFATAGGTSSNEYPQCEVWLYDDVVGSSFALGSRTVITSGDSNPATPEWGKYFGTTVNGLNPYQWIGACYSMQAGIAVPRVVRFGRERDADTLVKIAGVAEGARNLQSGGSASMLFPSLNSGPVEVLQTEGRDILSSEQLTWKVGGVVKSFSEAMGLPSAQLTETYYLPWYAHSVWVDTEIRIANVGNANSSVTVTIDDTTYGPYLLHPNESKKPKYPGIVGGPVKVVGTTGIPLVVSERMAWKVAGNVTTITDMIAFPDNQLTNAYSLPWYTQNTTSTDTELRISNVGVSTSSVTIGIGATTYGPYNIPANRTKPYKFPGENTGPVRVQGSVGIPLVVSERLAWKMGGNVRTVTESLGVPDEDASNVVHFPWYRSDSLLGTQLRISNIGVIDSDVNITIGSNTYGPFTVHSNETLEKAFPGVSAGPVKIEGTLGVPLVASEALPWKVNGVLFSAAELMGLPHAWLDESSYFTWYAQIPQKWTDTLVRMAMP